MRPKLTYCLGFCLCLDWFIVSTSALSMTRLWTTAAVQPKSVQVPSGERCGRQNKFFNPCTKDDDCKLRNEKVKQKQTLPDPSLEAWSYDCTECYAGSYMPRAYPESGPKGDKYTREIKKLYHIVQNCEALAKGSKEKRLKALTCKVDADCRKNFWKVTGRTLFSWNSRGETLMHHCLKCVQVEKGNICTVDQEEYREKRKFHVPGSSVSSEAVPEK